MTDGLVGLDNTPLFLIDGEAPPANVRYGYTEDTEQLVKSQRNSKGVVVSEVVGRRLVKFNNLEWPIMSLSDFNWLQSKVAAFYCNVTYYDSRYGGRTTRKFYWGDLSAEPFEFYRNGDILIPKTYKNVRVNLIDCGEG